MAQKTKAADSAAFFFYFFFVLCYTDIMPIRLIGTLIVAALAAVFTGFNLNNKCDVWLFNTFSDVPVAFTIIISLMAGVIITLPFTMGRRLTRAEKIKLREVQREEKRAAKMEKKNKKKAAKASAAAPASSPAESAVAVEAEPAVPLPEPAVEVAEPVPVPESEDKLFMAESPFAAEEEKKDTKSE